MNGNEQYFQKYLNYKKNYLLFKQSGGDEKSLYDRLGGVFAIAAVVNRFSDAIIDDPLVGKDSPNPALKKWTREQIDRLPGLKFMRTLWVCEAAGGPFTFSATVPGACHMSLENAHEKLHISPEEFDRVADLLKKSLEYYKVPTKETNEVLGAFAKHKIDVTKGYFDKIGKPVDIKDICPMHKDNK